MPVNPIGFWRQQLQAFVTSTVNITKGTDGGGGDNYAGVRFNSDGSIDEQGAAISTFGQINAGEWQEDEPSSIGADFDIRCTVINDGAWDTEAQTLNVWINLGTNRLWGVNILNSNSPTLATCNADFEIRDAATLAILTTFTVDCLVEN
jgi:hypothetical protein